MAEEGKHLDKPTPKKATPAKKGTTATKKPIKVTTGKKGGKTESASKKPKDTHHDADDKKSPTKLARMNTMEVTAAEGERIAAKKSSPAKKRKTVNSKKTVPNVITRANTMVATAKEGLEMLEQMGYPSKKRKAEGAGGDAKRRRLNTFERTAAEGAKWLVKAGKRRTGSVPKRATRKTPKGKGKGKGKK